MTSLFFSLLASRLSKEHESCVSDCVHLSRKSWGKDLLDHAQRALIAKANLQISRMVPVPATAETAVGKHSVEATFAIGH